MSSEYAGQNGPVQNGPGHVQSGPGQDSSAHDSYGRELVTEDAPPTPSVLSSVGLLLGRIVLGSVFIAHGWQKLSDGLGATQTKFEQMGIPSADIAAIAQTFLELGGGVLLIVGALTRLAGLLLAVSMFAAAWLVHREAFYVTENGFEFVAVLGAFALLFAFVGAGRFSVDASFRRRRREA